MTCVYPLLAAALSVSRLTRTVRRRHVTAAGPLATGTFRRGLQITAVLRGSDGWNSPDIRHPDGTFCRAYEQAARIPELALHGDRDDPLTFTAAPISRQLRQPYSRSMTDEGPPPQRGAELTSQAGLRASHGDRDRVVEVLRMAAGDGRLTAEELDERLEAALTARTYDELAALTTDLPAIPDSAPGASVPEPKDLARIDCHGSSVTRDGRWLVPRRMEVRVTGGSVMLDFTEAVILQPSLLIDADVSASRLTLVTQARRGGRHRGGSGRRQLPEGPGAPGSRSARHPADPGVRQGQRRPHHGTPATPDLLAAAAAPSPVPRACLTLTPTAMTDPGLVSGQRALSSKAANDGRSPTSHRTSPSRSPNRAQRGIRSVLVPGTCPEDRVRA